MASINRLTVGQILHHSHTAGNTTIRKEGHWAVRVVEIDTERQRALCSWNGNKATWYSEQQLRRLRVNEKKSKQ